MEQSGFEIEVLGMLGNDFEAPQTIAGDLGRDLGRAVAEEEIRVVLLLLAAKGWAQASVFEQSSGRFVPIEATEAAHEKSAWFRATPEGMVVYENTAT